MIHPRVDEQAIRAEILRSVNLVLSWVTHHAHNRFAKSLDRRGDRCTAQVTPWACPALVSEKTAVSSNFLRGQG